MFMVFTAKSDLYFCLSGNSFSRFSYWEADLLKSGLLFGVSLDFVHIIFVVREYSFAGVGPYAREHSLLTICTS